ncbi:hypothetical protein C8Q72DRAFT_271553 [Fomitopsis betulina]|nr:hypothetical protein C8Q72DRAFT_271553 [Fomitopsis betulina]
MDMGMTHPWVVRRLEERADGKRGEEGKREAKRTTYKMATQHPVLFPIWPLSITRDGVVPVLPARESARRGPPRDGAEMAASKRQVAVTRRVLTLFNIVDNEDTSTVEQRRSGAPSSCPVRPFLSGRTSSSASFRLHRCTRISFILPRTPLITVTRRQSGLRADRPALRSQTVVGPYRPAARTPERVPETDQHQGSVTATGARRGLA